MYFTYSSMYLSVTISKFIPPHFPSGNRKFVFYICDSNSSSVVAQSCPTLCNLMDCSPPGSSVHGILQARTLQWVAIPFSRGSSWPRIESGSPALQADSLPSEPPGKPLNATNPCLSFHVLASGILVPQQGIASKFPALEAWSLNHWTTREIPLWFYFCFISSSVPFF